MGRCLLVLPIICRFCTINIILSTLLLTFNMFFAYIMGQNPESAEVARRVYVIAPLCLLIALSVEIAICCMRKYKVRQEEDVEMASRMSTRSDEYRYVPYR